MKLTIKNPKESKSGMSMNFQYKGKWYTIKMDIIKENGLDANDLSQKIISIEKNDFYIHNGWTMIEKFTVVDEELIRYEPLFANNSINKGKSFEEVELSLEATQEFSISDTNVFHSINPLSIENGVYADSYSNISWKIEYSLLKENKESQMNSIISAVQNFISRGIDCKNKVDAKYSFISILILEVIKKSPGLKIVVPSSLLNDAKKSMIDAQNTLDIFLKLSNESDFTISKDLMLVGEGKSIKIINKEGQILLHVIPIEKRNKMPISFITKKSVVYGDFLKNKTLINKLLSLSFGAKNKNIKKFKDEQIIALNKIMHNGGNVLAILKTGFGKSLIYQFATLLQPRIFINVFPIVALIKDQSNTITNEFGFGYSIDNEKLKQVSESKLRSEFLYTKRLFLITPERIENQKMQEYFTSLGEYVGYMVFDEAHCISEWGHDFRPSYLMSKRLLENLTLTYDIKVIALTATAAPHIQKDIASLLNIDKANIVNIADSTGLKRKEIRYDIIHEDIHDFDIWNRSKTYANIIDGHIINASKSFKQLISFHMRAGDDRELEKDKFLLKFSAFSTYERLTRKGIDNITLFTGSQKLVDGMPENDFKKLSGSKHIIATKSFGMGINLRDCDYVLLSEPPYSLEDLYQQSGRVGRMGQESLVEILYHDNVLIDPYDKKSPYNFFLLIKDERKILQPLALRALIKAVKKYEGPFTLNVNQFLKSIGSKAREEHIMWAMAHLITKFKIIDKYSIEYRGLKKIKIHIIPTKGAENPEKRIKEILNKMRIISNSDRLDKLIEAFYNNYFVKLQSDKLTGINTFRDKLLSTDVSGNDDSEMITNVLTDYYRTRVDGVDKFVVGLMKKLINEDTYNSLVKYLDNIVQGISFFEVMESISRYEIDFEYVIAGSVLLNKIHKEKMLATNWNEIVNYKFKNEYIKEVLLQTMDDGLEHLNQEEIDNTEIKESLIMLSALKGLKNGR